MPLPADALDLAALIRPGDRVVCEQGTAEPRTLTEALVAQAGRIGPVEVFLGPTFSATFAPDSHDSLRFAAYGGAGRNAALARAGRLDVLPWHYSSLSAAFARGDLRADVVLLQVSEARDGHGPSLGLCNDYAAAAARHARLVLAEANPGAPWTYGPPGAAPGLPEGLRIDHVVEARRPVLELPPAGIGEAEGRIADRVAALIPDGATLQIGIGTVPDAILSRLVHHRDLGIHSGVIGDRVLDLVEAGAVTNARKTLHPGLTVAGMLWGTRRLYDHTHANPEVRLCPADITHGHPVLARIEHFHAVNSAIEVDLSGQVNAEVADGVYLGAVGGQLDFVRGANASPGGRSIIALPATARRGQASRIVPALATVTSPRSDADLVVTEWGVAALRGCTLQERARRLIAVAAPPFREGLERAWREAGPRGG